MTRLNAWSPEDGDDVGTVYVEGEHGVIAELSPDTAEALASRLREVARFARLGHQGIADEEFEEALDEVRGRTNYGGVGPLEAVHEDGSHTFVEQWSDENDSPREDSNVGVMLCYHRDYDLGDSKDDFRNIENALDRWGYGTKTMRYIRMFHGARVVLKVGMIDHSGISLYPGGGANQFDPGGWDSGTVGLIFDTPETLAETMGTDVTDEDIEKALIGEIHTMDDFVQGNVYVVTTVYRGDDGKPAVESVGGIYASHGVYGDALVRELAGYDNASPVIEVKEN